MAIDIVSRNPHSDGDRPSADDTAAAHFMRHTRVPTLVFKNAREVALLPYAVRTVAADKGTGRRGRGGPGGGGRSGDRSGPGRPPRGGPAEGGNGATAEGDFDPGATDESGDDAEDATSTERFEDSEINTEEPAFEES